MTYVEDFHEDSNGVEDLEDYYGYYPVKLGQVFRDRYEVFHKLGHGTYSTVWLALDRQLKPEKYVALKVDKAAPKTTKVDVMAALAQLPDGPGKPHLMTLLDSFDLVSPSGESLHRVMVSEVLVPWSDVGLTIAEKKCFIKQIMSGVEYLHTHGVTHGDLHPKNFMLQLNAIAGTLEEVKSVLGPPATIPVKRRNPSLPDELVYRCRNLLKFFDREKHLHGEIIDFGSAYLQGFDRPEEYVLPDSNCAPEVILGVSDGFQPDCDVWALGCSIYEIIFGSVLLDVYDLGMRDARFIELAKLTGRFPDTWTVPDILVEFKEFYTTLTQEIVEERWEKVSADYREVTGAGPEDAASFVDLLRGMLQVRPEDRTSLADLRIHPWFSSGRRSPQSNSTDSGALQGPNVPAQGLSNTSTG